jgi:hypothetical protein
MPTKRAASEKKAGKRKPPRNTKPMVAMAAPGLINR